MTMIVTVRRDTVEQRDEIEMLLPWHVTGMLSRVEAQRVDAALANNPGLAQERASIQEEYNEVIMLHDGLGAPSSRALHQLFAAIEAEPPRRLKPSGLFARFVSSLSPRTLGIAAGLALLVLVAQAFVIGWRLF